MPSLEVAPTSVAQRTRKTQKIRAAVTYTLSKNDIDVAHYNFDTDQPILIIFGR